MSNEQCCLYASSSTMLLFTSLCNLLELLAPDNFLVISSDLPSATPAVNSHPVSFALLLVLPVPHAARGHRRLSSSVLARGGRIVVLLLVLLLRLACATIFDMGLPRLPCLPSFLPPRNYLPSALSCLYASSFPFDLLHSSTPLRLLHSCSSPIAALIVPSPSHCHLLTLDRLYLTHVV